MKFILIFLISSISTLANASPTIDSTLITPTICAVSVDTIYGDKRTIYWKNTDTNITKFIIYNKSLTTQLFDSIGTVQAQKFNLYVDSNILFNFYSNSYKIQALNDSGNQGELSPEAESAFFEAIEVVDDSVVKLTWSIGNQGDSVVIWRRNFDPNYSIVKKLSINDITYLDTIPWAVWLISYRLEIIKSDPCYSSNDTTSKIRIFSDVAYAHFGAVNNKPLQVIRVFPNPVNNILRFSSDILLQNAKIKIYNTLGQEQLQNKLNKNELDVSALTEGIYYFIINKEDKLYQGKFVKRP